MIQLSETLVDTSEISFGSDRDVSLDQVVEDEIVVVGDDSVDTEINEVLDHVQATSTRQLAVEISLVTETYLLTVQGLTSIPSE